MSLAMYRSEAQVRPLHIQINTQDKTACGIVPLFWSQPGLNLKPAPRLDRTPSESLIAMQKHFDRTVSAYGSHVRFVWTPMILTEFAFHILATRTIRLSSTSRKPSEKKPL